MNNFDLHNNYLELIKKENELKICLIGQDPYPKKANGIAFCKNEFEDFFENSCCGKDLLYSLGFDQIRIKNEFLNPIELFNYLLINDRIAFINISHSEYFKENNNLQKIEIAKKYFDKNSEVINKSKNIILVGKSFEKLYSDLYQNSPTEVLIHPSPINKAFKRNEWDTIYASEYLREKYLEN